MPAFDEQTIQQYTAAGHWTDDSLADLVRRHGQTDPLARAFIAPDKTLTWAEYDHLSTRLAGALTAAGLGPGSLVGVYLPDGALVHVVFLAAEKAGITFVGIGPRTGVKEVEYLLQLSGSSALITMASHRGTDTAELYATLCRGVPGLAHHLIVGFDGDEIALSIDGTAVRLPAFDDAEMATRDRWLGPNDLFCLNSTSGTTGRPKLVMQTQNIWKYFEPLASQAGQWEDDEVFLSLLPAPFGFGLWTSHIVPTVRGNATVLLKEFDVEAAFQAIERHRVTVLGAVSTQFVMMLNSPAMGRYDLTSLRTMFTGGERVPFERAAEFEERTGCAVLQFYGSNEAGPISVTRVSDTRDRRLRTSGRIIADMNPRLYDPEGNDITASGGPGQCGCRGPGITPGYYADPEATAALFREDGWLLTGDLVEIDQDGYLTVVGRASDFIIRGGHNISAVAVEDELASHARIAQVAAVGMPDDVLGERVCVYVVTKDGGGITLEELTDHLRARGVSKWTWPERVVVTSELPVAPGGKLRKAELRADIRRRLEAERVSG